MANISPEGKNKKSKLRIKKGKTDSRTGKKKITAALITLSVILVLFVSKGWWLPKLSGIGKQYHIITNSGELADGNYPIEVDGGKDYQVLCSKKEFAVMNSAYIFFYNQKGELLRKRQHSFVSPVMLFENGRALVYESGGNEFSVETSDEVLYTKTFDNNILLARISPEGYTAVVTTSDNFECEFCVYDKKGESIYERKCYERINDLDFKDESTGCIISYINAENGSIVTSVQNLNFTEDGEVWKSPGVDTLGLNVYCFGDGAFVYGLDGCGYIDEGGQITSFYRYDGEVAGGGSEEGKSAVIINNEARRRYVMALFDGGGSSPTEIELDDPLVDVAVYDGIAYVMCKEMILAYDFDGVLRSTAVISDSYSGFARNEKYIFLRGFGKVDRIDYDT